MGKLMRWKVTRLAIKKANYEYTMCSVQNSVVTKASVYEPIEIQLHNRVWRDDMPGKLCGECGQNQNAGWKCSKLVDGRGDSHELKPAPLNASKQSKRAGKGICKWRRIVHTTVATSVPFRGTEVDIIQSTFSFRRDNKSRFTSLIIYLSPIVFYLTRRVSGGGAFFKQTDCGSLLFVTLLSKTDC